MLETITPIKEDLTPKFNKENYGKTVVDKKDVINRVKFFSKHIIGLEYFGKVEIVSNTIKDDYSGERYDRCYRGAFSADKESYKSDLDNLDEVYSSNKKYDSIRDSSIEIKRKLMRDIVLLNDTILHELIHYKNWYTGLDHMDGEPQFEDELKKYKVSSNYIRTFDPYGKVYKKHINREAMIEYENMYQDWKNKESKNNGK